jgi:hypothetical protein
MLVKVGLLDWIGSVVRPRWRYKRVVYCVTLWRHSNDWRQVQRMSEKTINYYDR